MASPYAGDKQERWRGQCAKVLKRLMILLYVHSEPNDKLSQNPSNNARVLSMASVL